MIRSLTFITTGLRAHRQAGVPLMATPCPPWCVIPKGHTSGHCDQSCPRSSCTRPTGHAGKHGPQEAR